MRRLSEVPGIAWVILFSVLVILAGLVGAYWSGRSSGAAAVHRAALRDSARVVHATVDSATKVTAGRVVVAERWRGNVAAKRQDYARARALAVLDSTPPAVVALVFRADTLIAQQDTTIQVQASALAAFQAERDARIAADSVEAHEIALEAAPSGHGWPVAAVLGTVALVLTIVHFVR